MNSTASDTRQLLIDSFKNLMIDYPFKKITIKMITEGAHVIRPTFYNHFRDKYEIFEAILDDELFDSLYDLLNINMTREATKMIFTYFDKNREFYKNAFEVTGQNSFKQILIDKIIEVFLHAVDLQNLKSIEETSVLTNEQLVKFSAINIVLVLEMWLIGDRENNIDADQIFEAFLFLVTHNLEDYFETY